LALQSVYLLEFKPGFGIGVSGPGRPETGYLDKIRFFWGFGGFPGV